MADWGPFVQGLAGTLPRVAFQTYELGQRDHALQLQQRALEQKMKQQQIAQDWHIGGQLMQVMQNKNLPKSMRLEAYNNLRPVWERNGLGSLPEMKEWDDSYSDVAKKAFNIYQDETLDQGMKLKGIRGLYAEAQTEAERNVIKDAEQRTIIQSKDRTPEDTALLTKDQQNALKPQKTIERTVDLGDKVEYIYSDGTKETKAKGKLPGSGAADELSKNIKMDKYHSSLVQQSMSQAGKEAGLKFNTQPVIQLGGDGKPVISFPNNPEAHAFYVKRVSELSDQKVRQAVKRKALTKDYLPEETPTAPKQAMPKEGDVVDGYRFKGGNPADKNNWEKQ